MFSFMGLSEWAGWLADATIGTVIAAMLMTRAARRA
jgi:hypothetical protein